MSPAPALIAHTTPDWSILHRIVFRFAFVYLFVYTFPRTLFADIPGVGEAHAALDRALVLWFGRLILPGPIAVFPNGSGDTTYNYVQLLCYTVLSLAAACLWSALDRRRPNYTALHEILRIQVRYVLAMILMSYGMAKVLKSQFPQPDIDVLGEPFGEASPMRLLWTFMGYSTPYTVFAGISEVLPGLLLFFRRTTMLGALIGAAVMTNVVLMNFSYDVPVKLYSSHLLLMCVFLLLPDLRRLASLLVLNRPVDAVALQWPWRSVRWMKIGRWVVKPLYMAIALFFVLTNSVSGWKSWGDAAPVPALYGAYNVESAVGPNAWQRVFLNRHKQFVVELADHTRRRLAFQDDGRGTLALTFPGQNARLTYRRLDAEHLHIEGTFENRQVSVNLRKAPAADFLLLSRGFHWINEFPFNR